MKTSRTIAAEMASKLLPEIERLRQDCSDSARATIEQNGGTELDALCELDDVLSRLSEVCANATASALIRIRDRKGVSG